MFALKTESVAKMIRRAARQPPAAVVEVNGGHANAVFTIDAGDLDAQARHRTEFVHFRYCVSLRQIDSDD